MKIMFEPTNSTEAGCDYVKFYKDSNYSEYYGSEKYSGKFFFTSKFVAIKILHESIFAQILILKIF
jgi:hypothetical protein